MLRNMATNKNALIRYKILDNCFRNIGKRYFINDLIEECNKVLADIDPDSNGISRRQVFDDIAFMESGEGWAIDLLRERDGKKVYYRYADSTFSINNMPLNEMEINNLQSAIDILSQFKGMPQFEWIHELVPKLNHGISRQDYKNTIIEFDNNQYLKGIEYLGMLHNSIYYKKVLNINYKPFENENPYMIEIHPYYLKQYNNRWFLFGYNPKNDKYDWNLALDRIISIKELESNYNNNCPIVWADYFEDIIGVTKPIDAKIENVKLHFFGKAGKYIESKPLHGSQKSKWISKDLLEVNLELIINYEFERVVLSFCDSVKVINPKSFTDMIEERLQNALKLY
jgi:predicted DNA-binding transcriptional regulator YafY